MDSTKKRIAQFNKIRVLVVDDSAVIRRLLKQILTSDPQIEVVGLAANGRIALEKITQVNPDIITLDIEMPEMDGLETLKEIKKSYPKLPVLVFSIATERGAMVTLDALAYGASDYIMKPSNVINFDSAIEKTKSDLITKIKNLCSTLLDKDKFEGQKKILSFSPSSLRINEKHDSFKTNIVTIGASTGGPNALLELLSEIPANFPVPILVVQHMPPVFTNILAKRLNAICKIPAIEAYSGVMVKEPHIWIAPGNYHMTVERKEYGVEIITNQAPAENSCRPSVDVLFRSAAKCYGGNILGVVMTGMGEDGLRGSEMIVGARGEIFVQDEATSVVWGMPGAVARAGLASKILPLGQLARQIIKKVEAGKLRSD